MMNRRQFLRTAGAGMAGLALLGQTNETRADGGDLPNVLIVIGDDMTCRDCEPYGSPDVKTPNMAKLAAEGTTFDAMFTATAMCAPTRQQLYTGMFPVRNGAYPNHSGVYNGVRSIVHYLGDLGYRVGLTGKKHFSPAESFAFEFLKGRGHDDGRGKDLLFDAAEAFVQRDKSQPYCLIVASNQPHGPWNRGDASAYEADKLTVPRHLVDCPETRAELTKYYAEITYLDGQLGKCLDIVERSGQRDNTIVIFTSEQGASFPSGGKWTCYDTGLQTAFIVRWPAQVKAGTRTSAMTQYVDVVPTLIEAAGGDPTKIETGRPDAHGDKGFDGKSFLGVLLGKTNEHRDYVYGAHTTRGIIRGSACYPVRSVRSWRYKYIWNPNYESVFYNAVSTGPNTLLETWTEYGKRDIHNAFLAHRYQHRPDEELYDVHNDPFELINLAQSDALVQIKAELRQELLRWMDQQGDEGVNTELRALERQGPNRKWTPYNPHRPTKKRK
jgi:uncharacterized sulfatase